LKRKKPSRGGLVHAFSGSFETATRYLDLGFTISVGASPVQGMRPSSEH
jgi:TatD DNase family protein